MPHKYPFLRSSVIPFGLMEQLGVALTMDPDEEGTTAPLVSWFGRLLSDDFTFEYKDANFPEKFNKEQMVNLYFQKVFSYSAYDWECLKLETTRAEDGSEKAVIEGEVDIKSDCRYCSEKNPHDGEFNFRYEIARPNRTSSWKVKKWIIIKKGDGEASSSPRINFI